MMGSLSAALLLTAGLLTGIDEPTPKLPASFVRTLTNTAPRHDGKAICVVYSPDGKLLVSGGWDHHIRIWDATTGAAIRSWKAHDLAVWPLAFSADGKQIVSGGRDGNVILWDLTGREIRRFRGHTAGVYKLVWIHAEDRLLTASFDKSVREWDVTTGKELHVLTQEQEVHALAITPDRKRFATGTDRGRITLYDRDFAEVRAWEAHGTGIDHLAFSPDGKMLASGGWDRTAVLWDPRDGAKLRTLEGHKDNVWPVVFTPDGKQLLTASRDGSIRVWNPASGELVREIVGATQGIPMIACRPDGKVIAAASWDGTVQQWDLESGRCLGPTPGHLGRLLDLRWVNNDRELVSLAAEGRVLTWDTRTSTATLRAQAQMAVARLGILGQRHAVLQGPEGPARLLDLARPFTFQEFALGTDLAGMRFSHDERQLIALTQSGAFSVHAIAEGVELARSQLDPSQGLSVSPDGSVFVSSTPRVGLRWHRTEDARLLRSVPLLAADLPRTVAHNPDGRLVVGVASGQVIVWEAVSGIERFRLALATDAPRSMAFSPEGRWLFLGEPDGGWRAVDLVRGVSVVTRQGPKAEPTCLAVSDEGRTLAVGRADGKIDLWNLTLERAAFTTPVVAHSANQLRLWRDDLASSRAEKIQAALAGLYEAGPATIALMRPLLKPTPRLEPGRVQKLITQLESDEFDVREMARLSLLRLGTRIEKEITPALERSSSLDQRRLLESILTDLLATPLDTTALRELRQIEVLERLKAFEAIEPLTQGDPDAPVTRQAREALARMRR